jgi:chemosensory pili system protein ChpA (sensor histidine kinase/response regulator)
MSRRAQERILMAQVTGEIQANLNHVEEVLDRFFRDPEASRDDLPQTANWLTQIHGALSLLQLATADQLFLLAKDQIERFAEPDAPIDRTDLDWVAEAFSALRLYLEAVRFGHSDDDSLLQPTLRKRMPQAAPEPVPGGEEPSIEKTLEDNRRGLEESLMLDVGLDEPEKKKIHDALSSIRDDAELAGNVTLRAHAQSALNLLREQESPDPDAIKLALNPDTTVATDIEFAGGDEAQQTVDAELLQVYLEEAEEVLERIRQNLDACRQDPGDLDALTVIRRGFHTLKGSGRMVGLVDLGEVAWELEQTMNSWVQEERPAIPRLLDMIGHAYDSFRMWIKALTENGHARVNAESLAASARALRTGEPTTAESAVSHLSAETTETATGESATETPAAMGGTLEPEPETSSVEPTQTWEAADILGEIGSETAEASPEVAELMAADPAADAAEELFAEPVHEIPETVGEDLFEPGIPAEGLTPESEQAAEIEQIPMADEVIIGEHRIAAALFDIFLQEAGQHLATLNAHQRRLESVPPPAVEQEFVRAAHTLAGISRTTGFAPLAELAHALERWLMALVETPVPPMSEHVEISRAAIQAMGEMLVALSIQKWPGEAPGICAGLVGAADVVRQGFVPAETAASGDQTEVQECETLLQSTPQATPNRRLIRDDLDPQLLPIFLEEAAEIYPNISALMRTWQGRPQDAEVSRELQRALHTFKGSARMAGALRLGELTHKMESEVLAATETGQYGTETFEELFSKLDRMEDALEALKQPLPETPELPEQVAEASVEVASVPPPASALVPAALANVAESELRARQALRIRDDVLDRLVNEAGEVAIARSRLETETSSIKHTVIDLTENLNRLRGQLRDLEIQAESQMQSRLTQLEESSGQFDPLEFDRFTRLQELTRMMAESVNDIGTVQSGLLTNIGQAEAAINQQARMTRELQRALMSIRLTPLATLTERLHKVVRRTAKELEKKVNLDLTGMHVEIDRSVLEKIVGPLEHLLRNAVAHGIEMPDARRAAGKAELGEILMVVRQEGSEVTLTLSDDGAGLNLDRIRQRAIDSGLLNPSVIPSAGQLADLIFRPGFSTAEHVSEVAGRGIGMDVVRSEIAGLGGRVEVSTESGKGTRFTITLPVNLAVTHVVLVEADGGLYAIPSTTVEQVREIKANELPTLYEQGQIRWMENDYPMHYLPWMLGHSGIAAPAQRHNKLLLLKSGAKRVAVQVDSMAGNREVVVKPIGPQLARVAGISGATVLGDGRIVLIINPVDMAERASRASEATTVETPVQVVARQETTPLAMIVDDSLTVRRLTSRLLERAGYRVVTAKDGQDALERLHDELPDVILLDIEMPRMDGFEFTRHARADSRSAGIPIIMITSRTAEKHRTHAYELGVNAYLGKPYQEDELLAEMRALLTAAEKAKVSATAAV